MIFYITEYLWFTFRKPSYYAVNCTLYATTNIVFIKIIPVQFCLFSFFVGHLSVVSLQLHLWPKRFWNDTVYWLFLWTAIVLFFLLYYIELLQFPLLRVENPWACFSGEQEQKASFSPLPIRERCREAAWAHYRQELSRECCSLHGFWAVAWALGTIFRCPLASTREKKQLESYRAPSLGLSSAQANRRIKVGPGWPAFFPLNCWWRSQPAAILWVSFLFQLSAECLKKNRNGFLSCSCKQALLLNWSCCCTSCRAGQSLSLHRRNLSPQPPSIPKNISPLHSVAEGQRLCGKWLCSLVQWVSMHFWRCK